jgi:hypothetical protein
VVCKLLTPSGLAGKPSTGRWPVRQRETESLAVAEGTKVEPVVGMVAATLFFAVMSIRALCELFTFSGLAGKPSIGRWPRASEGNRVLAIGQGAKVKTVM